MYLDHSLHTAAALPSILALSPLASGWIGTIVIGFLVGVVAKLISGGKEPTGCLITIIIGIVGSVVALYIGRALGFYEQPGQAPGFIASVIGAIILLAIYHFFTRRSGGGPTV